MKVDYFVAWYKKHARNILEGNEDAGESYDILKKCEELHLYDRIISDKKKKKVNWDIILKVASLIVGLGFNLFLCGCIFQYEKFAPIVSRCFGFIKPMAI